MGTTVSEWLTCQRPCRAVVAIVVLWLNHSAAQAQRFGINADVGAQLTWSSNSNLGTIGGADDTILELNSHAVVRSEGARVRLNGVAGLRSTSYLQNSQPNALVPEIDLNGRLEAVERLLYIEAGYRATQVARDPYGARPESAAGANSRTAGQTRLSPYVEGAVGPTLRYRVRSDNTWANELNTSSQARDTSAAGYYGLHTALMEVDPRPFGWRVSAERSDTHYEQASRTSLTRDAARLGLRFAPSEDLTFGINIGTERNNYSGSDERRSMRGVDLAWQPTPRTRIDLADERQFFGSGWRLAASHRNPQFAFNGEVRRGIDSAPQSLFELPPTGNVASLLDAIFTTRYPNPADRAQAVQDYMANKGLPTSTSAPITLFSQRLSVATSKNASVALNGVRSSLVLSAFDVLTEDALDAGLLGNGTAVSNNHQKGMSLLISHRLGPRVGMTVGVDWSRIRGVGAFVQDSTSQRGLNAKLNVQLDAKTAAFVGARYRKLQSTAVNAGQESALFAGIGHEF